MESLSSTYTAVARPIREAYDYPRICLPLLVNSKLLQSEDCFKSVSDPWCAWHRVGVQLKHPELNGRQTPREQRALLSLPASLISLASWLLPPSQVPVSPCKCTGPVLGTDYATGTESGDKTGQQERGRPVPTCPGAHLLSLWQCSPR